MKMNVVKWNDDYALCEQRDTMRNGKERNREKMMKHLDDH